MWERGKEPSCGRHGLDNDTVFSAPPERRGMGFSEAGAFEKGRERKTFPKDGLGCNQLSLRHVSGRRREFAFFLGRGSIQTAQIYEEERERAPYNMERKRYN